MMLKLKYVPTLALLATVSACGQPPPIRGATAPDVSQTSLCLIDQPISGKLAPEENADDPGNQFDTDETFNKLEIHNAKLRAACPTGTSGDHTPPTE